ncbi:hypothetical protein ACRALDRAFT_1077962 [Sodiomyces alcalophilus JCM 7366]|uniref:uncharacterized protein n=1 Tax=Sodiomyces alcalophilus JCM 7366 TaxID=591952 RepID=UPI0039B371E1
MYYGQYKYSQAARARFISGSAQFSRSATERLATKKSCKMVSLGCEAIRARTESYMQCELGERKAGECRLLGRR